MAHTHGPCGIQHHLPNAFRELDILDVLDNIIQSTE
jgi:hypothetical protein